MARLAGLDQLDLTHGFGRCVCTSADRILRACNPEESHRRPPSTHCLVQHQSSSKGDCCTRSNQLSRTAGEPAGRSTWPGSVRHNSLPDYRGNRTPHSAVYCLRLVTSHCVSLRPAVSHTVMVCCLLPDGAVRVAAVCCRCSTPRRPTKAVLCPWGLWRGTEQRWIVRGVAAAWTLRREILRPPAG